MPTIIAETSIGPGERYHLYGEDFIVPPAVQVISSDAEAVTGTGSFVELSVFGMVFGETFGIRMRGWADAAESTRLYVAEGASLNSNMGIGVGARIDGGSSSVVNYGSITGSTGLVMTAVIEGQSTVTNHGVISGTTFGIVRGLSQSSLEVPSNTPSTEDLLITNYGTIEGGDFAFYYSGATAREEIRNRGDMIGFLNLGDGDDVVDNRGGRIEGDVFLGGDHDLFDNRGGTLFGTVRGGAGNDTMVGNNSEAEVFDAQTGTADVLDFRLGAGAHVALDGSFGYDGAAAGDSYTGFEVIYGSNVGNDRLRGGAEVNSFLGNGGNDFLDGGAGADALRGGTGTDTLMGGAGNDLFRLFSLAECGDLIVDFYSNSAGNNDSIQISAAAFGGGLVAGVLAAGQFQSRADNLAQDANDRFIFRTTDTTLWFDADGSGAGAAILVADMQAWATMTAADILIL